MTHSRGDCRRGDDCCERPFTTRPFGLKTERGVCAFYITILQHNVVGAFGSNATHVIGLAHAK